MEEYRMAKKVIVSAKAPKVLGPYSQANEAGGFVFVSGMLGVDPATKTLEATVEAQTDRALKNLRAVLDEAGLGLESVVKVTVFLSDITYFGPVNEVYSAYFAENCPARTLVAVAALPAEALVEIEAIAFRG
jgi:2-iminobutanoate/2-iminopropanoate deaminase